MNAAPFPGNGMRESFAEAMASQDPAVMTASEAAEHVAMAEALAAELAKELPTATLIDGSRYAFERQIAAHRDEKAKQQRISSAALAKARQLTTSIRSLEDALDSLLASEA